MLLQPFNPRNLATVLNLNKQYFSRRSLHIMKKTSYILLTKLFKADLATDSAREDVIFW